MTYSRRTRKRIGKRRIRRKDKQSNWRRGEKALMNGKQGHGRVGSVNSRFICKPSKRVAQNTVTGTQSAGHLIVSLAQIFEDLERGAGK